MIRTAVRTAAPRVSLSHRTDLRTGTPYWAQTPVVGPPCRLLRKRLEVDVAVIGAGVSGACMAHALAKRGRSVAVLDRRVPMMGSTVASTALLIYEIDRPLFSLNGKGDPDADLYRLPNGNEPL